MMVIIFLNASQEVSLVSSKTVTSQQTCLFCVTAALDFMHSLVGVIGSAIGGKSIVYYINYYAGHPESVSEVMSIGILGAGIGIPIWTVVARHLKDGYG